jgi:hypothetical protein
MGWCDVSGAGPGIAANQYRAPGTIKVELGNVWVTRLTRVCHIADIGVDLPSPKVRVE